MTNYEEVREIVEDLRARNPGKGMLFPTIHFGSFELLLQTQCLMDRPLAALARGFGLPRLDAWWDARREMFGNTIFSRAGGYKEIERRLNRGEDVTLLFDQNVRGGHAIFVEFFGIPAATTKAIGLAALRTGAPILFSTAVQLEPERHRIIVREIPNPIHGPGSKQEKVHKITAALHRAVEDVIREYPEQWFWIHRRYKTRPPGEPETMYS